MKFLIKILILLVANAAYASSNQAIEPLTSRRPNPEQQSINGQSTNDLFKSYLEVSSYRNKILSQNIANVNTPGYKADEVTMPQTLKELAGKGKNIHRVQMYKTSGKHMQGSRASLGKFSSHKLEDPDEVKKNGNNVSLRQQIAKLSQNKNDYSAAIKAYAAINSLYASVVGK